MPLSPHGPWPQVWADAKGNRFDIYPTAYSGVLNYGLDKKHAISGIFPTAETVMAREAGESVRDELTLINRSGPSAGPTPAAATGGMQLAGCNAVRLNSGTTLYRFGDDGGHKGGWWTERDGLFRMLLRVEPAAEGLPGVKDGSRYTLRDYARLYSEVLTEWKSKMKYLFATRLQGPIMAFRGRGAAQRSAEVLEMVDASGAPIAVTYEHMADDNRQLFVPNIYARIDGPVGAEPKFFSNVVKWHPEVLEHHLVPMIRDALDRGQRYREMIGDIESWMMRGDRRAPLGGVHYKRV